MKKMKLILILIIFSLKLTAPGSKTIFIITPEKIEPYEVIWKAVIQIESRGDPLAYNHKEKAYGIAQIRPIRLNEYNRLAGKNYRITDMYDPVISKEIFMYYAHRIGFRNRDLIIRKWNGSGWRTYIYLEKVKKHL